MTTNDTSAGVFQSIIFLDEIIERLTKVRDKYYLQELNDEEYVVACYLRLSAAMGIISIDKLDASNARTLATTVGSIVGDTLDGVV